VTTHASPAATAATARDIGTRAASGINGIDTAALGQFSAAVREDQATGAATFTVTTHWLGGTRSRAHVSSYQLSGQEHPRAFTIDADEPPQLLGEDTAPNPQELLLAALNACMTVGIVATAATRGVAQDDLRITTTGTLDLRGFLGLDPQVNPGYDKVGVSITVTSASTEPEVADVLRDALATSPNLNNFRGRSRPSPPSPSPRAPCSSRPRRHGAASAGPS